MKKTCVSLAIAAVFCVAHINYAAEREGFDIIPNDSLIKRKCMNPESASDQKVQKACDLFDDFVKRLIEAGKYEDGMEGEDVGPAIDFLLKDESEEALRDEKVRLFVAYLEQIEKNKAEAFAIKNLHELYKLSEQLSKK